MPPHRDKVSGSGGKQVPFVIVKLPPSPYISGLWEYTLRICEDTGVRDDIAKSSWLKSSFTLKLEILAVCVDGFFPPGLGDPCFSELSWCHESLVRSISEGPTLRNYYESNEKHVNILPCSSLFIPFIPPSGTNLSSVGETEKIVKVWKLLHKTGSVWA